MAKPIRGKNGKFAGSVGEGKTQAPKMTGRTSAGRMAMMKKHADRVKQFSEPSYANQYEKFQQAATPERQFGITPGGGMVHRSGDRWHAFNDDDELIGTFDSEAEARAAANGSA